MTSEKPKEWSMWLPLAEWWYNTHFYTSIQKTPYEIVYGQPPPVHLPYLAGDSATATATVDRSLQNREEMISTLKFHLTTAHYRMKIQSDRHRSERSFEIGEWVLLKLQAYRQNSVQNRSNKKLSPRYFGPFRIIEKAGKVAYELFLPASAQIHDVIHVSQLKKFHGALPVASHIPDWLHNHNVSVDFQPKTVLARRFVKQQNKAEVQYLVHWEGFTEQEASWEDALSFEEKFPNFVIQ